MCVCVSVHVIQTFVSVCVHAFVKCVRVTWTAGWMTDSCTSHEMKGVHIVCVLTCACMCESE